MKIVLTPDSNPWIDTYNSWIYQIFVRWLPAFIAFITFILGLHFIIGHQALNSERVRRRLATIPARSPSKLRLLRAHCNSSIIALVIETVRSLLLFVVLSLGGVWSAPHLPGTAARFCINGFFSVGFVNTALSARLWNNLVRDVTGKSLPCGRIHSLVFTIFCFIPLLFEFSASSMYAVYLDRTHPRIVSFNQGAICVIQFFMAVYFVFGAHSLMREIARLPDRTVIFRQFHKRMAVCVGGLTLSMLGYSIGMSFGAVVLSWVVTPTGWTVVSVIGQNCNIFLSFFHVNLFRPRPLCSNAIRTTISPIPL